MVSVSPSEGAGGALYCEIGGLPVPIVAGDLTEESLFVRTTSPEELAAEIEIFLRSDTGSRTLRGHVVQVVDVQRAAEEGRFPGYAVTFCDLSADAEGWLARTVAALTERGPSTRPNPRKKSTPIPARPPSGRPLRTNSARPAAVEVSSHPPPGADAQRVLVELQQALKRMRGKPPWEVLGVPVGTRGAAAKRAFLEASRRYHPHRFGKHDHPPVARAATELFILCKKAYDALASAPTTAAGGAAKTGTAPRRRPATLDGPIPGSAPPRRRSATIDGPMPSKAPPRRRPVTIDGPIPSNAPPRRGPVTLEGPVANYLRGATLPSGADPAQDQSKEWTAAKRGVDRNEADAELAVAAGMRHLVAGRLPAAYVELKRATELDPTSKQAELWRLVCEARIAKAEGHPETAKRKYAAVLELDPGHREALAETQEKPASDPPTRGRGLGRWFGSGRD